MAGAARRARVHDVLPDLDRALAAAREIRHPWYRCQSLSVVAERVSDPRLRLSLVDDALRAADEMKEPNRIVTVASWPVEILASRGPRERLHREVTRLMAVIATEPHGLRRADGLNALLHRAWADPESRERLLGAFRATCAAGHGWRRDRLLRYTAERLARSDRTAADDFVAMIEEDRTRRRAERGVAAAAGGEGAP